MASLITGLTDEDITTTLLSSDAAVRLQEGDEGDTGDDTGDQDDAADEGDPSDASDPTDQGDPTDQ